MKTLLKLDNVSVSFDDARVLKGVTLEFKERRVTALVGPNGAGKTTVFNAICGLVKPDEGDIYYDGERITGLQPWEIARRGIGRTFQDMLLFDRMTVLENVVVVLQNTDEPDGAGFRVINKVFQRRVAGRERALADEAESLLKVVGLEGKARELAECLSHGEQKLLSIARLLAAKARVLLLDEPIAWVHTGMVDVLVRIIRNLVSSGKTVIVIEHDLRLLGKLTGDDYFYMLDGGRVVGEGSPLDFVGGIRAQAASAAESRQ